MFMKRKARINMEDIPMTLKWIRYCLCLSQAELARRVCVSSGAVGQWELGTKKPSPMAKLVITWLYYAAEEANKILLKLFRAEYVNKLRKRKNGYYLKLFKIDFEKIRLKRFINSPPILTYEDFLEKKIKD